MPCAEFVEGFLSRHALTLVQRPEPGGDHVAYVSQAPLAERIAVKGMTISDHLASQWITAALDVVVDQPFELRPERDMVVAPA